MLRRAAIIASVCLALMGGRASADELEDAETLYQSGKYTQCIEACEKAIGARQWSERWWHLKIRSELAVGRYEEARKSYENAVDRFLRSVELRLLGYDVYRLAGDPQQAEVAL